MDNKNQNGQKLNVMMSNTIIAMYSATGLESKMPVFSVFLCVLACIL